MPLATGARLGPYRIDAEIGAGGMGHVFRATDTRLDRPVAIKVLPQHRWSDPELRFRFEREARALSALSHPNLCALYDVGELAQSSATTPYLVMELLEGGTLREYLANNTLSVRKALLWGAQIASGLAAAHQKGVVHRDLKPENVFVTSGELLKILDFGLSITKTAATHEASTALRTEPGVVMGTAHYMSPEQIRGQALDARSDIFSLGIVLYEMLSGRVPFDAPSPVETMNAILIDEPADLDVPDSVQALVRRCLEKDPALRFSSARDLTYALESVASSVTSSSAKASVTSRRSHPRIAAPSRGWRFALLGALAAVIVGAGIFSRERGVTEPPRLRMLTYSGRDSAPAASPDGRLIAYVSSRDGTRRIWLEQLADGSEVPVTAGPEDAAPRFNADGSVLLFTRTSGGASALYIVPVVGGDARKLIDNAFDGDWAPDGKRIAFIRNRAAGDRLSTVCVASTDGSDVREIVSSSVEEYFAPRWSPTGETIAVSRRPHNTSPGSVLLIEPDTRRQRTLTRAQPHGQISGTAWTRDGEAIVYAELEALSGASFPERRGSSVILRHELDGGRASVLLRNPHSAADTVDVMTDGRIVFTEDVTRQSLQEVTLDGSTPSRWLSRGIGVDRQPAYAHGDERVLFTSDRGGNIDLWELTLASGRVRRLTAHSAIDWDPHPSRDGTALFWSSNRGGHFEVWSAALDGANPRQITRDGVDAENPSLPASGDWVFYDSSHPQRDGLWRVPRGGGPPVLVVAGETVHPSVSADGQYVVYQRPEPGGAGAIDVVRVADGKVFPLARGLQVFATRAQWIGATHTIAFRAPDANGRVVLFAQDFTPGTDTAATRRLLHAPEGDAIAETFTISSDGKRAMISVIDEASGLMMAEGVEALRVEP
jgi:serine/threonine protein kinase/Tol biopolymer transport system component